MYLLPPQSRRNRLLAIAWMQRALVVTIIMFVCVLIQRPFAVAEQAHAAPRGSSVAAVALRPDDVACAHSRVFIHVHKTGLGHEHAVEGRLVSGTIHLGAKDHAGKLVFDMKSFDADTPLARQYLGLSGDTPETTRKQVNDNMQGAKVLDTIQYPTAEFQIDSAGVSPNPAKEGHQPYVLQGVFTLHGVSKPVRMNAEVDEQKNGFLHLTCRFSVRQSEYGMKPYTAALGAVGVSDQIDIYGNAWIRSVSNVALDKSAANSR